MDSGRNPGLTAQFSSPGKKSFSDRLCIHESVTRIASQVSTTSVSTQLNMSSTGGSYFCLALILPPESCEDHSV